MMSEFLSFVLVSSQKQLTDNRVKTVLSSGTLDLPSTAIPGSKVPIPFPDAAKCKSEKEGLLTIALTLREATAWADEGHEVAWYQVQFSGDSSSPKGKTTTD